MADFVSDLSRVDERPGTIDHPTEAERGNMLLEALNREEWSLIEPHLERISLTQGQVLEERSRAAAFLYFPINGAVSR
jgi:hypothetical protein